MTGFRKTATIANMRPKNKERSLLTVDGYALTQVRINAGLSLSQLVKHIGCNKSTVSRWETGELNPDPERLWKLVAIFKTTVFIRLNGKAAVTEMELKTLQAMRREFVIGRLNPKAALTVQEAEQLDRLFPDRDLVVLRLNNEVVLTAEEIKAVKKLREA